MRPLEFLGYDAALRVLAAGGRPSAMDAHNLASRLPDVAESEIELFTRGWNLCLEEIRFEPGKGKP
jgi:hypothetical protein